MGHKDSMDAHFKSLERMIREKEQAKAESGPNDDPAYMNQRSHGDRIHKHLWEHKEYIAVGGKLARIRSCRMCGKATYEYVEEKGDK